MKSEYPDLDELNNQFKPFYDLTGIAYDVESYFKTWMQSPLIKQNAADITSLVN